VEHRRAAAEQQRLGGLGGGVHHDGGTVAEELADFGAQLLTQLVVEVGQGLVQQQQ
jgi:hypothetical protein